MNVTEHEKLKEILENLDDFEFSGKHGSDEIDLAEKKLGVTLPDSFKLYLKEWGNVSFGHVEYLGLTKDSDFTEAGFPNFVWYNILKRKNDGFPKNLIIFRDVNDEVYYCLNVDKQLPNNECGIAIWNNLDKVIDQEINVNFNQFIMDDIDEYIDLIG